jgi:hypothetical protein
VKHLTSEEFETAQFSSRNVRSAAGAMLVVAIRG